MTSYTFPAIRGIQARREYYVSMCPIRLIPKIFLFNEEELLPEIRAQRSLNKNRIPEIARYILNNRDNYTFSAITASIDAEIKFEPIGVGVEGKKMGILHIPISARFIVNDGQHRRAAIEAAIKQNPEIADESIAVVFFLDIGLERCQQMFADLNRYAIRPSKSLGVLYDHRDKFAKIAKLVAINLPAFHRLVDMERSTLSVRSHKLLTLSSIYTATLTLLLDFREESFKELSNTAINFWEEIAKLFPEWQLVNEGKMTSSEVRNRFVHSHSTILQAIGRVGSLLLNENPNDWKDKVKLLKNIDWSRSNTKLWEGRAMIGGRVSKSERNVTLTTNVIKQQLKLKLNFDEQRAEDAFLKGTHEQ